MFRIGEFSKIAQVSGRLLRYYDEIGLLTPEYTDSQTGYRYYTVDQLPRLNRILALKDLGFTLTQIADLIREDVPPEEIRGMLVMKRAQIEQSVQEEIARLKQVEMRLAQIEHEGDIWGQNIVLKRVPPSPFLSVREEGVPNELFFSLFHDIQRALPSGKQPASFGHFIYMLHSPSFEQEMIDVELGFLMARDDVAPIPLSTGRELAVRELAGVDTMATIVAGSWEEGGMAYNALGTWVADNGFQIVGSMREILFTLQTPEIMAQNVLEIQFPVMPMQTDSLLPTA